MNKSFLTWVGVIVGIFILIIILAKVGSTKPNSQGETERASLRDPVTLDDHYIGSPDAAIQIVEFSDFQCPSCAAAYPNLERLANDFPDDVLFVYRHFPLQTIHPQAQLAAQAAVAADNQGKFWEMHNLLFNAQTKWSNNPSAEDIFVAMAKDLDLDIDTFTSDLRASATVDRVNRDIKYGQRSKVDATPTVFINGHYFPLPQTYGQLRDAIDEAITTIKEAKTLPATPELDQVDINPNAGI